MNDPRLEPLDPELEALLDAERAAPSPAPAVKASLLSRLEATLGLPPGGTEGAGGGDPGAAPGDPGVPPTGPAPAAPPPVPPVAAPVSAATGALTAAAGASKLTVGIASLVIGGVMGAGIHATVSAPPEPPPAPVVAVAVEPPMPPAPPPQQEPPVVAEPVEVPTPPKPAPAPVRRPSRDEQLAAERALLEMARTSLTRGQPQTALEAIAQHARRHPKGQLAEERDSLWIRALVASGKGAEARARAEAFRARYPRSLLLPAVDAALNALGR